MRVVAWVVLLVKGLRRVWVWVGGRKGGGMKVVLLTGNGGGS